MKKTIFFPVAVCILALSLACVQETLAADDYKTYWNGLNQGAKETLLTAYLMGHYHGSSTLGSIYRKLFNKPLTLEQMAAADKLRAVDLARVPQTRTSVLSFMDYAYKDNGYAPVNIYDMMNTGLLCTHYKLPNDECLFLHGDIMKAKASP